MKANVFSISVSALKVVGLLTPSNITAYFGEPDSDGTGVGYSTCEDDVAAFSYVIVDANNVRCELKNGNVFMLQYTSNGIMFDKYKVSHQQDADGYNEFFWH